MGFPLCHLFLLSFVFIFNILSLFFFNLINMCWSVHPWVHPLWHSLHFLYLSVYFLYCVREVLTYNIFIFFLRLFLFCSPSETSITGMLVHLVLSQRSLILSSFPFFFFFFFALFCSVAVIFTTLSSCTLICYSASVIMLLISSGVFFMNCCIVHLYFFFKSASSL